MTRSNEKVIAVYQMWDAWCTFVGVQEEMEKCVI